MKKPQNIYDNPVFFEGYKSIRENPDSANILEEKPSLFALSPDLSGKTVLDLGCGDGENCAQFYELGAKKVVGIDISEKMLQIAKADYPDIQFMIMDMDDLSSIQEKFDVVFSSLAVHYLEDINKFFASVSGILNEGGYCIFSQEHPLTTAPIAGACWTRDEHGNVIHYNLTDYTRSGERKTHWIVDDVIKYHRTFSELINLLIQNGFTIEKMLEPIPTYETLERFPHYEKSLHKPNFLLILAKK
ncbi:MAG: class I SAM-dependent methyltransferase [Anaerolineaceae bacterium]|nr:class I SAM-dependent methyltransferase [Anaerolineaceae bacterium]